MSKIVTVSGKVFDYLKPEDYDYDIFEISHALSKICGFSGNTSGFYSVAQHSVIVAGLVAKGCPELAKAAILHDAAEAFTNDIPRPLKDLLVGFEEMESRIIKAILSHFDAPCIMPSAVPPIVKHYDRIVGIAEMRDLFHHNKLVAPIVGEADYVSTIYPVGHEEANTMFLRTFFDINDHKFNWQLNYNI